MTFVSRMWPDIGSHRCRSCRPARSPPARRACSWLVVGALGVFAPPLTGQGALVFEHFSVDQGLSQSGVTAVAQDRAGFIWIGTQDGLNRYDGYTFKVFRHDDDDPQSLSSSFILSLLETEPGVLWVGTQSGLNRFDTRTGVSTRHFSNQHSDTSLYSTVHSQLLSRSGVHWVGTGRGLAMLDPRTHQLHRYAIPVLDTINQYTVVALVEDRTGALWVGTEELGVVRLDFTNQSQTAFRHEQDNAFSLPSDSVGAIYEDTGGTIWLGTHAGLSQFDVSTQRFVPSRSSGATTPVRAIMEDATGTLWLGTEREGLLRFEPRTGAVQQFLPSPKDPTALGGELIRALLAERGGALWIGMWGAGLDRVDPGIHRFGLLRAQTEDTPGLNNAFVMSVHEDRAGMVWIGTRGGGLNRFDPATGNTMAYPPRLTPTDNAFLQEVRAITEDRAGVLWVTTLRGGVYRLDRKSGRYSPFRDPQGAAGSFLGKGTAAILEDRRHRLWIGGGWVLSRVDSARRTQQSFPNLPNARAVFEDHLGAIWVGTHAGLYRLDSDTTPIVEYQHDPDDPFSLSHSDVRSIAEDAAGMLWVGTAEGLNGFDRRTGRFTRIRRRDGLPNDFIYGIVVDEQDDLWLSTNSGLTRFNPRTRSVHRYDTRDGLQSNEFNTGAYLRGHSGRFYFGGIAGLNFFHPRDIQDNPVTPQVAITGFKVFNRPVDLERLLDERGRLVLPSRDDLISFEFSALSYRMPERNRYAYRLDGFDREWIDNGTKREATYTNLDPGSYTLRVKAANNDGAWNDAGMSLLVIITPPWWQTLWFRALAAVLVVVSAVSGVRFRFRAIQQQNEMLEALVEERTAVVRRQELALRDASRRAGMAEVAAGVLHNIGNVFNGVNVSATVIERLMGQSRIPDVRRAATLLQEHQGELATFLTVDERGRQLPVYLDRVSDQLVRERDSVLTELASLTRNIAHATQIIGAQQALAGVGGVMEELDLTATVRTVVELNTRSWERDGITLDLRLEKVPHRIMDRHQFEQVMVNLLLNARQSVLQCPADARRVAVRIEEIRDRAGWVRVQVSDTGVGIAPEHLVAIFNYGFTTRPDGHGFGLHSAANMIRSFGGVLRGESPGLGLGATFTIELPMVAPATAREETP